MATAFSRETQQTPPQLGRGHTIAENGLDASPEAGNIRCLDSARSAPHRARSLGMMIQHDMGPMPPNALAQETVDAVRRALQSSARSPAADPAPELGLALHALAREARVKDVPPEQLLVTLKGVWQALPEVQNARDDSEHTRVLQRIVTICIKEYFAR